MGLGIDSQFNGLAGKYQKAFKHRRVLFPTDILKAMERL
jgi:hypothetical protein